MLGSSFLEVAQRSVSRFGVRAPSRLELRTLTSEEERRVLRSCFQLAGVSRVPKLAERLCDEFDAMNVFRLYCATCALDPTRFDEPRRSFLCGITELVVEAEQSGLDGLPVLDCLTGVGEGQLAELRIRLARACKFKEKSFPFKDAAPFAARLNAYVLDWAMSKDAAALEQELGRWSQLLEDYESLRKEVRSGIAFLAKVVTDELRRTLVTLEASFVNTVNLVNRSQLDAAVAMALLEGLLGELEELKKKTGRNMRPRAVSADTVKKWSEVLDIVLSRERCQAIASDGFGAQYQRMQERVRRLRVHYHPDRAQNDADRRLREFRSKELNEAWVQIEAHEERKRGIKS